MAINEGILAEGILAEGSIFATYVCGTPAALTLTANASTTSSGNNVSLSVGTSSIDLTVNAVTISATGSITVSASLIDELVITPRAAAVDIIQTINVTFSANTHELEITMHSANAGELSVVGLMSAAFTASAPSVGFASSQPLVTFTVN